MKVVSKAIEKYKEMNVVAKAGIWTVIVSVLDKAVGILIQPIVNRAMTIEEIGVYSVYTAWYSVFSILATMNLFCGAVETFLTKEKKKSASVVVSLMTLSLSVAAVFFGIVFCAIQPVSKWMSLKPSYIVLMAAIIIPEAVAAFWMVDRRFQFDYVKLTHVVVGITVSKGILSTVFTLCFPADRVFGRLLGLAIPSLIAGVILLVVILRKERTEKITAYWLKGLRFNLPLIPHYLASILLASSDRIMIEKQASLSEAGIYSAAYSLASLSLIVFSGLNSAATPVLLSAIKDKDYVKLRKTTRTILALFMIASLFLALLAPEELFILGGEKYLPAIDLVPVLLTGIFFAPFQQMFTNVEFIYEKTKWVFLITLLGAGVNIGLNWWLIPIFGYEVATWTTVIGYVLIAVCHFIISSSIVKHDVYDMKKMIWLVLGYVGIMLSIILLYKIHWGIRYGIALVILVCGVVLIMRKRKILH